ncbi:MAG: S1C family serine protease, partial [Verrucomicrobiota bacterium]
MMVLRLLIGCLAVGGVLTAQEKETPSFIDPQKITELTQQVKPSIVLVHQIGRNGKPRGTGSGFVIDKSGLIATNFHVIGEDRAVEVELDNGKRYKAKAIHLWNKRFDLAVLKIDPQGAKLRPLRLADSDSIQQGQFVAGFGAPRGLDFSVVPGVISAVRKLEEGFMGSEEITPDYPMIQLAMPIEQGNSGGPVVDLNGDVLGIVTLKHTVTANLGFAVRSNDLANLLEQDPNTVTMDRWLTIGRLDSRQWTPVMGANWRQRGGKITVSEKGSGFGGRSICVSERAVPKGRFDVSVEVKLDNEAGAAGL